MLHELGVPGPIRLVGHDIGGCVALSWARLFPDDVSHLAIVDTTVPGFGLERAMDAAGGGTMAFS